MLLGEEGTEGERLVVWCSEEAGVAFYRTGEEVAITGGHGEVAEIGRASCRERVFRAV